MSGSGALARRLDSTGYDKESIRFELLTRQGAQIPPISYWFGSVQCQNKIAERLVQHVANSARFFRRRNRNVETWIYRRADR